MTYGSSTVFETIRDFYDFIFTGSRVEIPYSLDNTSVVYSVTSLTLPFKYQLMVPSVRTFSSNSGLTPSETFGPKERTSSLFEDEFFFHL